MGNFDPKSIRDGKAWCDVVNTEPLPKTPTRKVLALGTCDADGSNYKPYEKPVEREVPAPTGSYIWLEEKHNG